MTVTTDTYDRLAAYGVHFEGEQGPYIETAADMSLAEVAARGGRMVRVRWIGGDYIPGRGKCYDLSYVHAVLDDGTRVRVYDMPAAFLVPRRGLKGALIEWAKESGVFAKGVGLLDESVWSILG